MKNDTDIIAPRQPESVDDRLAGIARDGARRMLAAALRAEADAFVAHHAEEVPPDGRQRVVRHGYGPERSIRTGIGALDVRRAKVRDRAADGADEERIRFTSAIPPKWARRSKSLDALLPALCPRGLSTRGFPGGAGRAPGAVPRYDRSPGSIALRLHRRTCRRAFAIVSRTNGVPMAHSRG